MNAIVRSANLLFAKPEVAVESRADGSMILRSLAALKPYPMRMGDFLEAWAAEKPKTVFLAERDAEGKWDEITYAEAHRRVYAIATWLLGQNLSPERPVAVLCDNSVDHALMMLAAMHIGVPVSSMSPAYSLVSKDFAKLKANVELLRPGVILVDDYERFAPALAAIADLHDGVVVTGSRRPAHQGAVSFVDLLNTPSDTAAVKAALQAVTPETISKFLFTSGSTGAPKAVINTQRMMCSSQQAKAQVWPFLEVTRPILLDWLPWSHTFGSNHNFNLVLRNGGTLYIDTGKPVPGAFNQTLANLRDIAPTAYFNVPRGFDMLVSALKEDEALCRKFFSQLQLIFYAGSALPQNIWDELNELSMKTLGFQVPVVSAWGSTETAPLAADTHFVTERSGIIGVPVPGVELKLLPTAGKLEIRVRGPNVTPGYWKNPAITESAFDEEGFYKIGDAVKFVDPDQPEKGLQFDGRVAEDFKLMSGTWVHVGSLRLAAVAALAPVAQDIVITGQDKEEIGFLIFPNIAECRKLCADLSAPISAVLATSAVRQRVAEGLKALKAKGAGSSTYAQRALLMEEPPSIDAGEITDKGYINQRLVLSRRAALVDKLHAEGAAEDADLIQVG